MDFPYRTGGENSPNATTSEKVASLCDRLTSISKEIALLDEADLSAEDMTKLFGAIRNVLKRTVFVDASGENTTKDLSGMLVLLADADAALERLETREYEPDEDENDATA